MTPNISFNLTSIVSSFSYDSHNGGLVTCSVYANDPSYLGGTFLTSGSTSAGSGTVTFNMDTPTAITVGDTYFVDFTGIQGHGVNVTQDPGAIMPGTEFYTINGQHGSDNSDYYDQPILSLNGTTSPVPEASTTASFGLLLCLGLGGLAWSARRRKTHSAE